MRKSPGGTLSDGDRAALAMASLVFGLVTAGTYLFSRVFDRLHFGPFDPRAYSDPHVEFYWRSMIAVWWGGFIAFLVFRLQRNAATRAASATRWLTWMLLAMVPLALCISCLAP